MVALGSVFGGERAVRIGLATAASEDDQLHKRVESVCDSCAVLRKLAKSTAHVLAQQVAWALLTSSVAHKLDYDMRVLPPSATANARRCVRQELETVVATLKGAVLSESERTTLSLPGAFGGLQMRDFSDNQAGACFLAAWQAHETDVQTLAGSGSGVG